MASATGSGTAASASASPSGPKVHLVKAGSGGFKFEPAEIFNVSVGDTITFEFYPPDHSVARAEFESPCVPYEYTGKDKVGFWSTTQWVKTTEDITHWNLTINSTEPIFFYCAAPDSCLGEKMIGVINPNSTQTLAAQKKAIEGSIQVTPGDPIPKEGSATLHVPGASGSPTAAPAASGGRHSSLGSGAIAGIVVGAVAFLVICAALFFYVGRTKSLKEVLNRKNATVSTTGHDNFGPKSPGYPYSPVHNQADYNNLPPYAQHNGTDSHPPGWASPTAHPQHMSMMSAMSHTSQPSMADVKHTGPAELSSPGPHQQSFAAELEAPIKSPR
ncbi:hypothetical protein BDV95DRAFT_479492 [Massariosphaeria phaeospora]|uniref:Cupredoxin n=1 Tax=Massariosphaeria phaeospora TaxID=100035 RepID=A0A7C8IFF1_9PLEO|nr:hypothetical protein BDV95DRAFT_479492 [Massariosphaeria phaeospora]